MKIIHHGQHKPKRARPAPPARERERARTHASVYFRDQHGQLERDRRLAEREDLLVDNARLGVDFLRATTPLRQCWPGAVLALHSVANFPSGAIAYVSYFMRVCLEKSKPLDCSAALDTRG